MANTLSKDAQAILDAADEAIQEWPPSWEAAIAAVLRTAAAQVAPSGDCPMRTPGCDVRQFQDRWSRWHQASLAQRQLLALAIELQNFND